MILLPGYPGRCAQTGWQHCASHRNGMGAKPVCRYNGRDFTTADMALLHTLLAIKPPLSRYALSREWCQRIGWLTPGGGLKDMSARLAMLAMQRDGRLTLPPPRGLQGRPKPIVFGPETDPPVQLQDCARGRPLSIAASLDVVRPLQIVPVVSGTDASVRWNAYLARYHYEVDPVVRTTISSY